MNIEVIGTGPELLKRGIRGIEPVIEETIKQAKEEIQIVAYVFTPSAIHVLDMIGRAAEKGVKVSFVINNLFSQKKFIIDRLMTLSEIFPNVRVFNFNRGKKQLHAKVLVVDRKKAVVGSANLSWGGMYSNYEIGLLIEGEPAWKLAEIIDCLSLMTE